MRVLVTRPAASAEKTRARLLQAGHDVLALPMSAAEDLPLPDRLPPCSALAATSAQALRALAAAGDRLAPLNDLPIYCVGTATAEAAVACGFTRVVVGRGDGDGLAARLLQDRAGDRDPVLYLAGTPRAPGFERQMAAAGCAVAVVEVYRMHAVRYAEGALARSIAAFRPEVVLFYSRETVRLFFSWVAPSMLPQDLRLLCLSAQVADGMPPGCPGVEIAPRPDEDALLALLDA